MIYNPEHEAVEVTEFIRGLALRAVLKKKQPLALVASILEVSLEQINEWLDREKSALPENVTPLPQDALSPPELPVPCPTHLASSTSKEGSSRHLIKRTDNKFARAHTNKAKAMQDNLQTRSYASIRFELAASFSNHEEFKDWCAKHPEAFDKSALTEALDQIRTVGIQNAFEGRHIPPEQIIVGPNLRDSLLCRGINSRIRAVLLDLLSTQAEISLLDNQIRIYAPEALTPLALLLRGRYPFFIGSEYLPTEADRRRLFPIPHQDLQALTFPEDVFHVVISNEVFEHLPYVDKALQEIHRILKNGGFMIATFPFAFTSATSIVKARLTPSGETEYLTDPEYHGNPVAPEQGALVYEVPGWDILDRARNSGFSNAEIRLRISAQHGLLADGINGILTMIAKK